MVHISLHPEKKVHHHRRSKLLGQISVVNVLIAIDHFSPVIWFDQVSLFWVEKILIFESEPILDFILFDQNLGPRFSPSWDKSASSSMSQISWANCLSMKEKKCIIIVVPNFLGNNREVNPDAWLGARNRVVMTELIRCFVTVIYRWATIMFKIVICLKLHSHILESTKLLTLLKFHNTLAFQYLTTLATKFIVTDIVMTKIKR